MKTLVKKLTYCKVYSPVTKEDQVYSQVSIKDTLNMIVYSYLDFFKCCFDKDKFLYYKSLTKAFIKELNCEDILPKIDNTSSILARILEKD